MKKKAFSTSSVVSASICMYNSLGEWSWGSLPNNSSSEELRPAVRKINPAEMMGKENTDDSGRRKHRSSCRLT
jgi:hypothetical protein